MNSAKVSYSPVNSFVIVTWNTKKYVCQCLESLGSQVDLANDEIIVVDNASCDGTCELVRDRFPNVKLIQSGGNVGFAKANNLGITQSRGRYLFLINPDVVLRSNCISTLFSYMEQHPEVGILGPKILNADLSLQESCKEFPTLWNGLCRALALDTLFPQYRLFSGQLMRYWTHDHARPVDILSGCFWMVRHSALTEVGYLDEQFFMYAEDKDWCKRFWDAGWSAVYLPGAEAIHFGGGSSSREPERFYLEMNRANLRYWKKHYGLLQQIGVRLVMLLHLTLRIVAGAATYALRPSCRRSILLSLHKSLVCTRSVLFEW